MGPQLTNSEYYFRLFERKPGKSVDQSECAIDKSAISKLN